LRRRRAIAQWNHRPDDNPAFREFDARFKSGLRRAGMPERLTQTRDGATHMAGVNHPDRRPR
jgi:hypothetical protein